MRLKGIKSIKDGNEYLEEYIEEHNRFYAVEAEKTEDMHKVVNLEKVKKAFCYKEERTLSKNLEVSYEGRILQIQTKNAGYSLRGARVIVEEAINGTLRILSQGKELDWKELLVKDHQGKVKNKKEILLKGSPSTGGRVA